MTQSSLATPCEPLDGGFNSGFSTAAGQQWNLTITDASKRKLTSINPESVYTYLTRSTN